MRPLNNAWLGLGNDRRQVQENVRDVRLRPRTKSTRKGSANFGLLSESRMCRPWGNPLRREVPAASTRAAKGSVITRVYDAVSGFSGPYSSLTPFLGRMLEGVRAAQGVTPPPNMFVLMLRSRTATPPRSGGSGAERQSRSGATNRPDRLNSQIRSDMEEDHSL